MAVPKRRGRRECGKCCTRHSHTLDNLVRKGERCGGGRGRGGGGGGVRERETHRERERQTDSDREIERGMCCCESFCYYDDFGC